MGAKRRDRLNNRALGGACRPNASKGSEATMLGRSRDRHKTVPLPGYKAGVRRRCSVAFVFLLLLLPSLATADDGTIGPNLGITGNGRHLQPAGTLVGLGNFPTGGALTDDGRYYWTVSTGRGFNDIRILSVRTGRLVQIVPLPGASGGVAMDPTQPVAYVSGVADSEHKDEQHPGLPGRGGDVVHVFHYTRAGIATETGTIPVPPPGDAPDPQSFPPTDTAGKKVSWPDRLAISRDGRTLLVPLNLADHAAIVDVASKGVRYVA